MQLKYTEVFSTPKLISYYFNQNPSSEMCQAVIKYPYCSKYQDQASVVISSCAYEAFDICILRVYFSIPWILITAFLLSTSCKFRLVSQNLQKQLESNCSSVLMLKLNTYSFEIRFHVLFPGYIDNQCFHNYYVPNVSVNTYVTVDEFCTATDYF